VRQHRNTPRPVAAPSPKGGGLVTDLLEGQTDSVGIAVDADSVYFTSRGEGTVVRLPKPE
jgi:hypothetical protein